MSYRKYQRKNEMKECKCEAAASGNFLSLLTVLFIGLKLGGVITWSWWWVLSPAWGPLAILAVAFVILLLLPRLG